MGLRKCVGEVRATMHQRTVTATLWCPFDISLSALDSMSRLWRWRLLSTMQNRGECPYLRPLFYYWMYFTTSVGTVPIRNTTIGQSTYALQYSTVPHEVCWLSCDSNADSFLGWGVSKISFVHVNFIILMPRTPVFLNHSLEVVTWNSCPSTLWNKDINGILASNELQFAWYLKG